MSPSQPLGLNGHGEPSSPTRRVNQQSSSQPKTPPPRNGSGGRRSKNKSKSPTTSKKSAPRQSANADRNGSELPSLASDQSDPIPNSPPWYPQCYQDDTSSEVSDDPDDPCLKIRHGRRRLRQVLKELQEMHRAALARSLAQDHENGNLQRENQRLRDANQRLQDDNERLQDYNQDLHLDNERFRSMNTQLHEDIRGLREDLQYHSAANRQAGTRLQDLRNEIDDLRETNGDPQNENAELRRSNRNLRADLHDHLEMYEEVQRLRAYNGELGSELEDLRRETGGGIADWTRRYDELERTAAEAEDASDRLRLRLRDVESRLVETSRELDRANNEINRLQATLDWIHQDGSDRATSHPTTPSQSTPRGSSAPRSASSPGSQALESSPIPSSPRRRRNVRTAAAAAPTRRMNTRSQVTGDANSRTPPPELFSPQRERQATRQRNASKPAGVSKTAKKTKKTTTKRSRK